MPSKYSMFSSACPSQLLRGKFELIFPICMCQFSFLCIILLVNASSIKASQQWCLTIFVMWSTLWYYFQIYEGKRKQHWVWMLKFQFFFIVYLYFYTHTHCVWVEKLKSTSRSSKIWMSLQDLNPFLHLDGGKGLVGWMANQEAHPSICTNPAVQIGQCRLFLMLM